MEKRQRRIAAIGIIIFLFLISGCTTIQTQSNPAFFDDTENDVENRKVCDKLLKEKCDSSFKCSGYHVTTLVCDAGECYCD